VNLFHASDILQEAACTQDGFALGRDSRMRVEVISIRGYGVAIDDFIRSVNCVTVLSII
jgi:hypothetical protein